MRARLETFLFAPLAQKPVRVFRIALAAMLAFNFWPRDFGPSAGILHSSALLSLYENVILTPAYWGVVLVVLGLVAAGWRPRLLGAILVLLLFPLAQLDRARQSRHVMLIVLACFSFVKSGERALRTSGAGPIWPIQLIRIQLSYVYGLNALWKSTPHYLSGDALVGMSARLPNFLIDLSDGYWHLGSIAIPVVVLAIASTVTEAFLAIGFWFRRTRWITAAVGIAFHVILQQIVQIQMLDLVCMFLYLAFLLPFAADSGDDDAARTAG